jgi:hypothetical protein
MEKVCTKCGQTKSEDRFPKVFGKNRSLLNEDGTRKRRGVCKRCTVHIRNRSKKKKYRSKAVEGQEVKELDVEGIVLDETSGAISKTDPFPKSKSPFKKGDLKAFFPGIGWVCWDGIAAYEDCDPPEGCDKQGNKLGEGVVEGISNPKEK